MDATQEMAMRLFVASDSRDGKAAREAIRQANIFMSVWDKRGLAFNDAFEALSAFGRDNTDKLTPGELSKRGREIWLDKLGEWAVGLER